MTKRSTKKALLLSVLSMLMCVAMLVGTTFAWFTDSVTSGKNKITAGNLDVVLEYWDKTTGKYEEVKSTTSLFDDAALWEPGHTEVAYLKVSNAGTLALKYQLNVNVFDEVVGKTADGKDIKLSEHLVFGVTDKAISDTSAPYTREEAVAAAGDVKGLKYDANSEPPYFVSQSGEKPLLDTGDADYVALVIYMPTSVGNEANYREDKIPTIEMGVELVATQMTEESDFFNNEYDKDATYPIVEADKALNEDLTLKAGEVELTVPAEADDGTYTLEVANKNVATNDSDETTVSFDIVLKYNDVKVELDPAISYFVEINVGTFRDITAVTHNGDPITAFNYDPMSGIVSFYTDSFSPYAVTYVEQASGVEIKDGKIVAGVFEEINPADYDATLKETDSEYIAINYTVDNKECYAVSKRSTTVVVSASDTVYTAENANYTVTNGSGKLWSIISGLQNNEHSTVYLLPGTYNEATTIYIYSSMDIIGLGDKDSVKVVKQSSSKSNRHLFNANGTKADYIEVTLRNLYLDATAKTTNSQDNAAVQSIRKSKVKCYDLTIVKGTGWDAVAFYVNGNNAVDGVKYPAYLYAENCTLNTTRTFGIVSTNGSYKFYHNNLTYNNGDSTYTTNSGDIKNVVMEADDWEW